MIMPGVPAQQIMAVDMNVIMVVIMVVVRRMVVIMVVIMHGSRPHTRCFSLHNCTQTLSKETSNFIPQTSYLIPLMVVAVPGQGGFLAGRAGSDAGAGGDVAGEGGGDRHGGDQADAADQCPHHLFGHDLAANDTAPGL